LMTAVMSFIEGLPGRPESRVNVGDPQCRKRATMVDLRRRVKSAARTGAVHHDGALAGCGAPNHAVASAIAARRSLN
jgi:hypothetical protein